MENQKKDRSKGGRRPLPKAEKKSETISFHCDQMTKMMIKKKVEKSHLAMRDFIQQALESAEITPAECRGYFDVVERFTVSDLCNLVVVSAKVVGPLTKEEVKHMNDLYRFAQDVNAIVKRGNASQKDAPEAEKIDYRKELAEIQRSFYMMLDHYLKKIAHKSVRERTKNNNGEEV